MSMFQPMPPQTTRLQRALVTGASGFVGACLVRRLLERGSAVHVILRQGSKDWRLVEVLPRLQRHSADICDAAAVERVLRSVRPQVVYHLAAHGAYEAQADAQSILQTNALGTRNLLESSAKSGVDLFVATGSSSEYGYKTSPMRETDLLEPNSVYAIGKAAATQLCLLYAAQGKIPAVVLRLFSVFGPWEEPSRLFPTVLQRARAGKPLEMADPGVARDFIYVDDVLDVLLDTENLCQASGEVLNVGSGVQTTLAEVVDAVRRMTGSISEVKWGAMPPRRWDTCCWVADIAKIAARFGWRPRVGLDDGIRRLAAWLETAGSEYELCNAG